MLFRSAAVAELSGGAEYLEILPSSNFILEVGDDMFARFAVARTLARPRMDDMRASRNFSFNAGNNNASATPTQNSPWGGGGGNPELKPFIADVVDVSFEKYFANRKGYVSLAAFYKNLESYVYTRSVLFDFTGYPTGGVTPVINEGVLTTPENGDGGWIKGLEFSVSAPFDIFHPALEGFGGVFSVKFPEVSTVMGEDKVAAIERTGANYVTAGDCGCLMHIGGLLTRRGVSVRPIHIAEILGGAS